MNPLQPAVENFIRERDRWILWAPVALGAGIVVYFLLPFEPPLATLLLAPVFAAAAWFGRERMVTLAPAVFALSLALGFDAAQLETHLSTTPMLDHESGVERVSGRLMFTEVLPDGIRLTLKDPTVGLLPPARTPVKLRIKLESKDLADVPPPGARIEMWAQTGPFSDPVMPGATDFRRQSYFRQLGGLGWSTSKVEVVDAHPPTPLRDQFSLLFERARLTLAQHVYARLSGDVAAMTAARLNGQQTGISKPVIEAMRIAGLAHLLSTSGFHVTIMGILIYFPLRAILALIPWIALRYPIKKWAAFGAILSTLFYTLLVGSQPATLRSMLMTGIAMLAIIADRRANAMRLVMLSAALAMLLSPDAALGPSFQMSFAAVFCLIAAHEKTFQWVTAPGEKFLMPGWVESFGRHMGAIIMTSLIATAATTPFAIYHFQTFSFYGFIANMLAIPLTSFFVMPCILMAYATAPFGLDGWFIDGAGAGIWLTIRIAETVAAWPFSIFYLPAMPSTALAAIVLGGLWLCLWKARWRWLGVMPIALGMLYPLYTPQPDFMAAPDGKMWAVRLADGRLAVSNTDHDEFVFSQWQERLGNPPIVDARDLPDTQNEVRCDDRGCVYRRGVHILAMPELEAAALEDCERADIVIAPFEIKDCTAKTVLDESVFWRHGSEAIYFNGDSMCITQARPRRGERPWSVGWKGNKPQTDVE